MRILQLVQSFLPEIGGAQWAVHHLSNELVARGHEVLVLAAEATERRGGGLFTFSDLEGVQTRYRVEEYAFGRRFGELMGRNRRAIRAGLGRLAHEFNYEVVHAHQCYYPGYCAMKARRELEFPLVVTDHGHFSCMVRGIEASPSRLERRRILWTVRHAPLITAPGAEAIETIRTYRAPSADSRRLVNGIAVPDAAVIARLREEESSDDAPPRILIVGRHSPAKGYDIALRAFAALRHRRPDARLEILGAGLDALRPLAAELGLDDAGLELVPPQTGDALWRRLARATLFWMPSRIENMPLAKYEAMCFALPCVLNDAPGVREDVVSSRHALLFQRDDPEDLCAQSLRLLESATLRAQLGKEARLIGERYRWGAVVEQYEDLYRELAGR